MILKLTKVLANVYDMMIMIMGLKSFFFLGLWKHVGGITWNQEENITEIWIVWLLWRKG